MANITEDNIQIYIWELIAKEFGSYDSEDKASARKRMSNSVENENRPSRLMEDC